MRRCALSVLAIALFAGVMAQPSPARPIQRYDFSTVDALLEAALPRIGGGGVLIMMQHGEVIHRKAYGSFDQSTVVPIASATKWLSAGVVMSLVDQGLISLDDPLSRYIPEFRDDRAGITIRQAFSHTSGLPSNVLCAFNRFTTLAQCGSQVASLPLQSEPGTEFAYGNASMHAVGRIAEIVTGVSWDDLFAARVANPLGMSNTDYEGLGQTDNPLIAGGARSSADDYTAFLQMLLDGGTLGGRRVLSESAVNEMLADQTRGARIVSSPYQSYIHLDPDLADTRYGIGNWLERVDASTGEVVGNSSQGAFGCSPFMDRRRDMVGVLLVYGELFDVMPVYLDMRAKIDAIVPVDDEAPAVSDVRQSKTRVKRKKDPRVLVEWTSTDDVEVTGHDVFFAVDGLDFDIVIARDLDGGARSLTWTIPPEVPRTRTGVVKVVARDATGRTGEGVGPRLIVK